MVQWRKSFRRVELPVDIFCCCPLSPHRSLPLSFCSHPPAMEVCPPSRLFSCRDPSWAERGGNQRYTTSHSSLCFLTNVGSPPRRSFTCLQSIQDQHHLYPPSNSTAGFALSSQTHTALDKCEWTRSLFEISQVLQPQTNVLFWEAGLVMLSGRPWMVVITSKANLYPHWNESMLMLSVTWI